MSYQSEPSHCSKMGNVLYDGCAVRHIVPKRIIKSVDGVNRVIETQEYIMTGIFVKNPTIGYRTLRGEGVLGWTPELGGMISVNVRINTDVLNIPQILTPVLVTLCEMAYLTKCIVDDFYFKDNRVSQLPSPVECSSNSERAWLECEYERDGEWVSTDTLLDKMHEPDSPITPLTHRIINACVQCGVDMGECNPRQYCRKYYCPN